MPRKETNLHRVSRAGLPADYASLLANIKQRIRTAQVRAAFSANAELIRLYWDIGRAIAQRQQCKGWGSGVIPRLARDLRNELPEVKGFSERNIKLMTQFYRQYPSLGTIGQPVVAQSSPASGAGQLNVGNDTHAVTAISPPPVAKSDQIKAIVPHAVAQLP